MIATVVTVTSTFLAGTFGAAAVASLILFLIMRELTSAHAEETGSPRSRILSHTLLVPIAPLLVAIYARSFGHERVRRRIWAALALSLTGLAPFNGPLSVRTDSGEHAIGREVAASIFVA